MSKPRKPAVKHKRKTEAPHAKVAILANVEEALKEMKLVKAGKLKGRDAIDFLNEL